MSREYTEYTKPCACGKGLVMVRVGTDDWGNSSTPDETILCPECKKKYEIAKALKQERLNLANSKTTLVVSYFNENYVDILREKFENAKSKKAVWQTATDLGIEDCSLTKFYKYYRNKDEYINELISWYRIEKIIIALRIMDPKLNDLFIDAKVHVKEFDDERAAANYMHYKGRI